MQQEIFYQLGDDPPVTMGIMPEAAETCTPFVFNLSDETVKLNRGDDIKHYYLKILGSGDKMFKMFAKPAKD